MTLATRYLDAATVEQLNHLQLAARRIVEGTAKGLHRSQFKGSSVEFRHHRPYVPGDDPRRLDWRVLARTSRPFVKEYDEETNLRCTLLLDCSGSMNYGPTHPKFDFARRLAAAFSYLMLAANESVGIATMGPALSGWLAPANGPAQLSRVINLLDTASPTGTTQWHTATPDLASRLGRRSLVIVISDFFAPVTQIHSALARLHHDRHEIICLRVLHPDEKIFPFQKWSLLQGLENEKSVLCEPAILRNNYLRNFNQHARELVTMCRSLSAEYDVLMSNHSIADSVTHFLKKRSSR